MLIHWLIYHLVDSCDLFSRC